MRALSRFTPRMQTYCVSALRARWMTCFGTVTVGQDGTRNIGPMGWDCASLLAVELMCGYKIGGNIPMGGDESRRRNSANREGKKGRNKGSERKWL